MSKNELTLSEMREHVAKLAKELGVVVQFGDDFRSSVTHPVIMIRGLNSESDYSATLHELGHQYIRVNKPELFEPITKPIHRYHHCHCNEKSVDFQKARLMNEQAAWNWARENAIEWTVEMSANYLLAIGSYIDHAHRKTKMSIVEIVTSIIGVDTLKLMFPEWDVRSMYNEISRFQP